MCLPLNAGDTRRLHLCCTSETWKDEGAKTEGWEWIQDHHHPPYPPPHTHTTIDTHTHTQHAITRWVVYIGMWFPDLKMRPRWIMRIRIKWFERYEPRRLDWALWAASPGLGNMSRVAWIGRYEPRRLDWAYISESPTLSALSTRNWTAATEDSSIFNERCVCILSMNQDQSERVHGKYVEILVS